MKVNKIALLITATLLVLVNAVNAQTLTQFGPDDFVSIAEGSGGFFAALDSGDRFSRDHDVIGDVNGDGVLDLVVGARSDDDGEIDAGAVYILFLNNDGTVQSNQKISMLEGGFNETLTPSNFFGYGVAGIGDYDNDNIPDIAVAATDQSNRSLYIIHLNSDGTVKNYVKNANILAQGLSAIGDINGDGRIDLVACDPTSDLGGTDRGVIRILFFDAASQIISNNTVTIGDNLGGFGTGLVDDDKFGGREVAMLGDVDNDGTQEMAVGAFSSDGGKGAVWILSLDAANYNVVSKLKIAEGLNGFSDILTDGSNPNGTSGASFGHAMCAPGDLNGDGVPDLITGANQQDEGWGYILYLNSDKTVKTYTRINNTDGGFALNLEPEERFSRSISCIGDLRGDGTIAINFGGGAGTTGELYLLFFEPCEFLQETGFNRWSMGNILFSNWNHGSQMLTSDSLTFEQCTFKTFETDAAHMTYNYNDGRCICMDSTATLANSSELSTAFTNQCYSGLALPVELITFSGKQEGCAINLNWTVASEENFSHYELEWSQDGQAFSLIAVIDAFRNLDENKTYQFNGPAAAQKNYYRLKMVDLDGTFEFSNVIFIHSDCVQQDFLIYPNPVNQNNGTINVQFNSPNENLQLEIIDFLGKIVIRKEINVAPNTTTTVQIALHDLTPGTYSLKIEGFNQVRKLVIQK